MQVKTGNEIMEDKKQKKYNKSARDKIWNTFLIFLK